MMRLRPAISIMIVFTLFLTVPGLAGDDDPKWYFKYKCTGANFSIQAEIPSPHPKLKRHARPATIKVWRTDVKDDYTADGSAWVLLPQGQTDSVANRRIWISGSDERDNFLWMDVNTGSMEGRSGVLPNNDAMLAISGKIKCTVTQRKVDKVK